MHEHIFVVSQEMQATWPGCFGWDEEREVARAHTRLKALKGRGVDTILDATVAGLGRNVRAVARAAKGTGLNVILSTGFYVTTELPQQFKFRSAEDSISLLTDLFIRDLTDGMENTDIKAGVLKCAVDSAGLTPHVEIVLRACARAHAATGAPITTHAKASNQSGVVQQRVFREEGVDLGSVIIGHTNQAESLDYIERLIDAGSYVGFDQCGIEGGASLAVQLRTLADLLNRGYGDRIVLSHDNMVWLDLMDPTVLPQRIGPSFPYGYIDEELLPALRRKGITETQISQLLVANPNDYFARRASLTPGC